MFLLGLVHLQIYKKTRLEYAHAADWACFRGAFLIMVLLHNLTESSYLESTYVLWFVFLLLGIVFPTQVEPGTEKATLNCPGYTLEGNPQWL